MTKRAYIWEETLVETPTDGDFTSPADGDFYYHVPTRAVRSRTAADTYADVVGDAINTLLGTDHVFLPNLLTDDEVIEYFKLNGVDGFSVGTGDTTYVFADGGVNLVTVDSYTPEDGDTAALASDESASSTGSAHLTSSNAVIDTARSSGTPAFSNSPLTAPQLEKWSEFSRVVNSQDNSRKAPQLVLIYAASPGAWGNALNIVLREHTELNSRDDISAGEVVELRVYENGLLAEDPHIVSRTPDLRDGRGQSLYIEDVLLRNSNYIRAVDSGRGGYLEVAEDEGDDRENDSQFETQNGGDDTLDGIDGNLSNGDDGATPDAGDYQAGYSPFRNLNTYPDIKFLMDGGQSNAAVAGEIGAVAAVRDERSQGILNLPVNAFNTGWRDSSGSADTSARAYMALGIPKTKFCCAYGPRVLWPDEFNRREIFIPVDGIVAGNASEAAALGRPYDPVAGPELGVVTGALDVKERLTDADLDYLYDSLRVNPIRYERGYGINIWGQRTLEAIPTQENDLHVRLTIMDIGPRIVRALRTHIYRRNTEAERFLVYTLLTNFMETVQRAGGVDRFEVVCDATNNPAPVVEQNRMIVWIFIWPPNVTEQIEVYPILTPRGVSLSNAVQALAA